MFNQEQYVKLLKPITDTQKDTSKDVIKALKEYAPAAPAAPAAPTIPAIEAAPETNDAEMNTENFNRVEQTALTYMAGIFNKSVGSDRTFGPDFRSDNRFHLGNKIFRMMDNDIYIDDKLEDKFEGTAGLWELITRANPQNYNDGCSVCE